MKKIIFLISFPVFGFILVSGILYFYDLNVFSLSQIFSHQPGSDVIGVVIDKPSEIINADVEYAVSFSKIRGSDSQETLKSDSKLKIVFRGPLDANVKILVPMDVAVLAKTAREESSYKNFHAFIAPVALKQGESKSLSFKYRINIKSSPYRLKLLAPRGKVFYKIKADFPATMQISGRDWKIKNSAAGFEGRLSGPKTLFINYEPVKNALLFIDVKMLAIDKLQLRFNRPLAASSEDPLNFSLIDLNKKNSEVTDRIFIKNANMKDNNIFVDIQGMTLQRGESYELLIKDIADVNGNFLKPNSLKAVINQ